MHELTGQTFAALQGSATGLDLLEGLAAAGEFGNDGIDGRSPDEGLGIFVPRGEGLCRKWAFENRAERTCFGQNARK